MTMSSPNLALFAGQKYLNLESVKRDGTPVQIPVWFAEEQGVLYVYTLANAGKVKRVRCLVFPETALASYQETALSAARLSSPLVQTLSSVSSASAWLR
jgi:hypothetical protein